VFQIGTSLREARMRQALDLVDAESATKIRTRYLQALEEERFDTLPSPTYVKGFLRSYAEYLGLDGQLYVDEYNSRHVAGDDELRPASPRRSSAGVRPHGGAESRALVLALAGIVTAAVLVILAWNWAGEEPERTPGLGSTTTAATQPRTANKTSPVPPAKRWIALTLTARRGNTLLSVRRGGVNGRPIFSGTLERGMQRQFTGRRLWFEAASPGVLDARLNGHPYRLPGPVSEPAELLATRLGIRRAGS
jgi:cytoskeleton protein RodZ